MPYELIEDGRGRCYKRTADGTCWPENAPDSLIRALLPFVNRPDVRLRFDLGDTATGRAFAVQPETVGYLGRGVGPIKVPLIVHSRSSSGGPALNAGLVVAVYFANKKYGRRPIWEHPTYQSKVA